MSELRFTFVAAELAAPQITVADDCHEVCSPEGVADLAAKGEVTEYALARALEGADAEVVEVRTSLTCRGGGHRVAGGLFHCMAEVDCDIRSLVEGSQTPDGGTPPPPPYQPPYTV